MALEGDIDLVQALAQRIEPLLADEQLHIVVATLGALLGEAIFNSADDQSHAGLMLFVDAIAKQLRRQLEERLLEEQRCQKCGKLPFSAFPGTTSSDVNVWQGPWCCCPPNKEAPAP